MNAIDLLEAVGSADEKEIADAEEALNRSAPRTRWVAALAACLAVMLCIGILPGLLREKPVHEIMEDSSYTLAEDTSPLIAAVPIYYIQDGTLLSEERELEVNPQKIFPVWREKNGIGEEVVLYSVFIDTHGTESRYTVEGNEVATYTPGEYTTFEIRISAALKEYFPEKGEKMLLDSLEKTLVTPYFGLPVDEFNLIYE